MDVRLQMAMAFHLDKCIGCHTCSIACKNVWTDRTRIRLKPVFMMGGYGQFTFHFNYWGPTGVNRDTHILVRKLEKLIW